MRNKDNGLRNVIIGLMVLAIFLLIITHKPEARVDDKSAKAFVLEDLKHKYPNASVSILSSVPKKNERGETYYEIKAKVVLGEDTPCPKRMHIYYNYPEQNFVPQPPDIITDKCKVCENEICTIVYPEEATIASHTFPGTEEVENFIRSHKNVSHHVEKFTEGNRTFWKVSWTDGNETINVTMYANGTAKEILKG